MPVTKPNTGRVVAAPARCKRYNIPDSELKGLGLRVEPRDKMGAAIGPGMCRRWLAAGASTGPSARRRQMSLDVNHKSKSPR
jgi:hypothetical protein